MSAHTTTERQHPSLPFLVLALAGNAYALLQSLVAPALPDIQHALHCAVALAVGIVVGLGIPQ